MVYAPHPFFNAKNFLEQQSLSSFLSRLEGLAALHSPKPKPKHLVGFSSDVTLGEALQVSVGALGVVLPALALTRRRELLRGLHFHAF